MFDTHILGVCCLSLMMKYDKCYTAKPQVLRQNRCSACIDMNCGFHRCTFSYWPLRISILCHCLIVHACMLILYKSVVCVLEFTLHWDQETCDSFQDCIHHAYHERTHSDDSLQHHHP